MKIIPRMLWIVAATLLVVATARLPYGYYIFTRIVVCGIAGWIAIAAFQESAAGKAWAVAFALIAVLFNPIIPVHLHRSTWFYLDFGVASIFVAHLLLVRQRLA